MREFEVPEAGARCSGHKAIGRDPRCALAAYCVGSSHGGAAFVGSCNGLAGPGRQQAWGLWETADRRVRIPRRSPDGRMDRQCRGMRLAVMKGGVTWRWSELNVGRGVPRLGLPSLPGRADPASHSATVHRRPPGGRKRNVGHQRGQTPSRPEANVRRGTRCGSRLRCNRPSRRPRFAARRVPGDVHPVIDPSASFPAAIVL